MSLKILAIETSTDACSAALLVDNEIQQKFLLAPQQHTQLLLTMIDTLLIDAGTSLAQLDALAFGCGPGSFTGIRIAAGIIQGLAFSHQLPVVPISSLRVIAQGAWRETGCRHALICIDARVQQIYWGIYNLDPEKNIMMAEAVDQLLNPTAISLPPGNDWTGIGNGWEIYSEIFNKTTLPALQRVETDRYPQAFDVVSLAVADFNNGVSVNAEQALPVYLRGVENWKKLTDAK